MPQRIYRLMVALLVALTLAAGCAPSRPAAPQTPVPPDPEPRLADIVAETVLEAPLGEGTDELGAIFPENAEDHVPGAFTIGRNAVLILDTVKARVLEYRDGSLARAVPFPEVSEGASLAVDAQGDWYIYDAVADDVLQTSPHGEVKARWPVPERLRHENVLSLKQGASGEVVLALGTAGVGEYGLAEPLAGPTAGLSFPGRTARYTLALVGPRTATVCADGKEKWRLLAPQRLSGASLLGFDGSGCLLAVGADLSVERSLMVFALHPDGGVTRAILDVKGFPAFPDPCLAIGEDGELYFLAFTRDRAVIQRLILQPRD